MRRWRDRACTCLHPRYLHAGSPIGWTRCGALRCGCHCFDAAWAARAWGRWHRLRASFAATRD